MRVALDTTFSEIHFGGTGTYTRELAARLPQLLGDGYAAIRCPSLAPARLAGAAPLRLQTLYRDLWWTPFGTARAAKRAGAGLLHLPATLGPAWPALPFVLTLHDVAVLRYPELFRSWFRNYARVVLPRAARAAAHVITVSEAARTEILDRLAVPADRLSVVPNGVGPEFRPVDPMSDQAAEVRARYRLPETYALSVGVIEPRKNLVRLLAAVRTLRSRTATAGLSLLHAGPYGWLYADLMRAAQPLVSSGAVRFLGPVPLEDLPALYSLARLTVYPSLYEGFGLPVLEAMACGSPVVTSSTSALTEVAGDAAVYADPLSPQSIGEGMERLWTNGELRAQLRQRGLARAGRFTWDQAAEQTVAVYHRVARRDDV